MRNIAKKNAKKKGDTSDSSDSSDDIDSDSDSDSEDDKKKKKAAAIPKAPTSPTKNSQASSDSDSNSSDDAVSDQDSTSDDESEKKPKQPAAKAVDSDSDSDDSVSDDDSTSDDESEKKRKQPAAKPVDSNHSSSDQASTSDDESEEKPKQPAAKAVASQPKKEEESSGDDSSSGEDKTSDDGSKKRQNKPSDDGGGNTHPDVKDKQGASTAKKGAPKSRRRGKDDDTSSSFRVQRTGGKEINDAAPRSPRKRRNDDASSSGLEMQGKKIPGQGAVCSSPRRQKSDTTSSFKQGVGMKERKDELSAVTPQDGSQRRSKRDMPGKSPRAGARQRPQTPNNRRQPFENIPRTIVTDSPVDMNGEPRSRTNSSKQSQEEKVLGNLQFEEGHAEEEIVFGDEKGGKKRRLSWNPFSWVFRKMFSAPVESSDSISSDEDNQVLENVGMSSSPGYGNTVEEPVYDKRSVASPAHSDLSNPSSNIRNTRQALVGLKTISMKKPQVNHPVVKEKPRNTKQALADMEPISIRKYSSIPRDSKSPPYDHDPDTRAALADMTPVSVGVAPKQYKIPADSNPVLDAQSVSSRAQSVPQGFALNNVSQQVPYHEEEAVGMISPDEAPKYEEEIIATSQDESHAERFLHVPYGSGGGYNRPDPAGQHNQRRVAKPTFSFRFWLIILAILTVLAGAGVGIAFWFDLIETGGSSSKRIDGAIAESRAPTGAPLTPSEATVVSPTAAPTVSPTASPNTTPVEAPTAAPVLSTPAPDLSPRDRLIAALAPFAPLGPQSFTIPTSPQYRALEWLLSNRFFRLYSTEKQVTRYVLAVLYYSTFGDEWTVNTGWLGDADECTWYAGSAPACNVDRVVANLVPGENDMQGTLPAELRLLSNSLTRIDFGGSISGQIPSEYGDLTRLTSLRLRGNDLSGAIPVELRNLTSLTRLDLNGNRLIGPVPPGLLRALPGLTVLDLGQNQLSGLLSSELTRLPELVELHLNDNGFSGPISSIFEMLPNLRVLNLYNNELTSLPADIGLATNLETLSIGNNRLAGTIPTELGLLVNLKGLLLNDNAMRSTIPTQLGSLTNLKDGLDLSSNMLTGTIPSEFGRFRDLSELQLFVAVSCAFSTCLV
jgi:Leucine-rich repeat (LRR) protein